MGDTITSTADRDALLRFLDLQTDIGDLINRYQDLGIGVVAHALKAKANEAYACAMLPQQYRAPPVPSEKGSEP